MNFRFSKELRRELSVAGRAVVHSAEVHISGAAIVIIGAARTLVVGSPVVLRPVCAGVLVESRLMAVILDGTGVLIIGEVKILVLCSAGVCVLEPPVKTKGKNRKGMNNPFSTRELKACGQGTKVIMVKVKSEGQSGVARSEREDPSKSK